MVTPSGNCNSYEHTCMVLIIEHQNIWNKNREIKGEIDNSIIFVAFSTSPSIMDTTSKLSKQKTLTKL